MQFTFFAGLLASILHVLSGPDHLAAVTPFAIETKRKAWKVGLFWGIGHLAGMIVIGLLFYFFRELIPVEKISNYSEQLVGIVLIFIGIASLYKIFKEKRKHKHLHIHAHNPKIHTHPHQHHDTTGHHHAHHSEKKQNLLSSFLIGFLHGLAGIAHFILFLPVLGFEKTSDALLYIFGFALGILIAMIAYAAVIGRVSSLAKNEHNDYFFNGIRLMGGIFALIIGVYWLLSTNPG
ncbi:urease accessory protein UreH domain-containing protein [Namhaeicola litoreus]|uniref:Sulfite exporter TauE/SafE family protein n=1 Tax=Namhaeicola litoreus TaxID=1052145 RepID=A0ABW3Y0I9_9FLAO